MKKKELMRSIFCQVLFLIFTIGFITSCSEKEYDVVGSKDDNTESFKINLSFDDIPVLSANPIQIANTRSGIDEEEEEHPVTRAIDFVAPSTGEYPSVTLKNGSTIDVYLLLYPKSYYNNKLFYSKDPVSLTVKNGKLHFSLRQVEFVSNKGFKFSGDLAFHNKDSWMLSAVYAPGATLNNGKLSFEGTMPKRFVKANEKIEVGRDFNIPFVLGTVDPKTGVRNNGVPLEMSWDKKKFSEQTYYFMPEGNKSENYSFSVKKDAHIGFYPIGTLFALRFKNDMKSIKGLDALLDNGYWVKDKGFDKTKRYYDYYIKTVYCRSTSAKGEFDLGKSLDFHPNKITTQEFNIAENAVPLDLDSNETPWLYLWQNSKGGADNNSLDITFEIHNKQLAIDYPAKAYLVHGTTLENGKIYHKTIKLKRPLTITPLYTLAPAFTSFIDAHLTWGKTDMKNSQTDNALVSRGVGRPYSFGDLIENNNRFTKPFTVAEPNGHETDFSKLKWVLPSEKVIRGIFPAKIKYVSDILKISTVNSETGDWIECTKACPDDQKSVTVDGLNLTDKAFYYSDGKRDVTGHKQHEKSSLRVYYGIRYIGTHYVSAWRYIEVGKWNGSLNKAEEDLESKYVIQSRALPLMTGYRRWDSGHGNITYKYVEQDAKDYLKDVIAKNSFWSDDVRDNEQLSTYNVYYRKPDVIQREFPLVGIWVDEAQTKIGSCFAFWLYPTVLNKTGARLFQVSNHDRENMHVGNFNGAGAQMKYAMVLPVLMPGQGKGK